MVGTTSSHYKIIEKIGQGGMGEVVRAEDTILDREAAIKVLPEQFTSEPKQLARFEREAKLLDGWVAILALGMMFGCTIRIANETNALSNLKRFQFSSRPSRPRKRMRKARKLFPVACTKRGNVGAPCLRGLPERDARLVASHALGTCARRCAHGGG